MDYKHTLISLGLSKDEASVYVSLLEIGSASPTQIEKQSGMHRPLVYKALASLQVKGLVTVSPKGSRKIYVPESPDKLSGMFRKIESDFLSNVEDLHKLYSGPKHERPSVMYANGEKAIRNGLRDVVDSLNKGEIYYRYSPGYDLFDKKRFLPKKYQDMRDRKQLERFIISNEDGKKHRQKFGRSMRVVPRSFDLFNDRISLTVYKNKVLILDYDSQSAITITHAKFAEFQKKLFKLLYSKL